MNLYESIKSKLNEAVTEADEDDHVVRYTVFCKDSPIAEGIFSYEEAKDIAKKEGGDSITRYFWNNWNDYNEGKEADSWKDFHYVNYSNSNDFKEDNSYESIKSNSLNESNWMTYQNQIQNTLEAAQNDLDPDRFEEFCEGVIQIAQEFLGDRPSSMYDSEQIKCKKGDTVYWVGAGNEIGATGTIVDFPTEGRMTIKWDDGDVNTYDIDHPSIQLADRYDNSFNEAEDEKTEDSNVEDITWLLDDTDWKVDITTNERLGSDRSYRTLVKNVHDAETFNYHSDYWGSADGYQEENVNFMEQLEPYIDKAVKVTFEDGTEQKFKVLGLLIDKQYNSISHSEILVEEVK